MNKSNIGYRLSLAFIVILFIVVLGYSIYDNYWKSKSEVRYTVCTITDRYITSKDVGKKFEYIVEGKKYQNVCNTQDCIDSQVGSRFIIKYYVDNPSHVEIITDMIVKTSIDAPDSGWVDIPEF